jgi:bifunctional non-homologous end joining protein LigD
MSGDQEKQVEVGKHKLELSNLDKVFFPEQGITKGDLIEYYRRAADIMLPHLQGRPISMQRFPDGIQDSGFYQKEVPDYFPDWIDRTSIQVEEDNTKQDQVVIDSPATLVYLVNQGMITPHIWLSRQDKIDYPDKLIFDLDPPGDNFEAVRHGAQLMHDILDELGLKTFVMTTGSKGLHVVIPLDRSEDFDTVREFASDLARVMARRHPDELTVETRKNKRKDRLFLDYLRNSYAQTSVAPYAVRAKPGAPVATPVEWRELSDADLGPQSYNINNIFRRLGQKEDPWKNMMADASSIQEAREKLQQIEENEE